MSLFLEELLESIFYFLIRNTLKFYIDYICCTYLIFIFIYSKKKKINKKMVCLIKKWTAKLI